MKGTESTKIEFEKVADNSVGGATIRLSVNKILSKEERDLIADASEQFFNQISEVLESGKKLEFLEKH